MTRKRLKKLIMSYGYQRNEAEIMCWIANGTCKSYKEYYAQNRNGFVFHKAVAGICAAIKKTSKRMGKAAIAIKKHLPGMMETVP